MNNYKHRTPEQIRKIFARISRHKGGCARTLAVSQTTGRLVEMPIGYPKFLKGLKRNVTR